MNPATIRRIDSWIGQPACAALTAGRRLRRERPAGPLRRILFVKMVEQGATVLAHAAVQRAVDLVGADNVYFWVFEENRPILDLLGLIPDGNVQTIRSDSFPRFLTDVTRGLARFRRLAIDATVDMEFFARAPAVLAYLTGAQRRVGLHRFTAEAPYRGDLMTHRVQHNPYLHVSEMYLLLVEGLLEDPGDLPLVKRPRPSQAAALPRFEPHATEVAFVRETLARQAGRAVTSPIVLLNPNAGDLVPLRRWPAERFVELGSRLRDAHPEATVVVTGAPAEQPGAEALTRAIDGAVNMAGQTTLRQLLTLYSLSDVLVTSDSGPGHFSALTGVRTVVMFGPETPALFGPVHDRAHVLYADLACSPCVTAFNHRFSPCTDNLCMQAIGIDEVFEVVSAALSEIP